MAYPVCYLFGPIKLFQVFFFQLHFNKSSDNDFTVHIIISEWLGRQKCRKKRQKMGQKDVEVKQEIAIKCFHSFKLVLDHAYVCFFFLISLWTYSQSLADINICTASCDFFSATLHLFSPNCFVALTVL